MGRTMKKAKNTFFFEVNVCAHGSGNISHFDNTKKLELPRRKMQLEARMCIKAIVGLQKS